MWSVSDTMRRWACLSMLRFISPSSRITEKYRRRMGRENKGEAAHDLSRFLCFGKEGVLRGREFGDQVHTFSCLSVLHNAVVACNIFHIESIVNQQRAEGKNCDDHILSLTTPLM